MSDSLGSLRQVSPGTVSSNPKSSAGYSWQVALLNYVEETYLKDDLAGASNSFVDRPFENLTALSGEHYATTVLPIYRCPSFRGGDHVLFGKGSEYDNMVTPPAMSNYVAIVGTHANADGTINENGTIISMRARKSTPSGRGVRERDMVDGLSKTIMIAESVEPIYAAWIDGQTSWVVGLAGSDVGPNDDQDFPSARATMLGRGVQPTNREKAYSSVALPGAWPGRLPRHYGPSSHHSGNVVLHAFADGHGQAISIDVDPSVYYGWITRDGGEPVPGMEDL